MLIVKKPVENFATGRQGHNPEAVVLHLAGTSIEEAYSKCQSPHTKTSYHYMISRQGQIWQLVDEDSTAWHAPGLLNSQWKLLKPKLNVNLYTIGIAVESSPGQKWSDTLTTSSKELINKIGQRWNIHLNSSTVISAGELNSKMRPDYKAVEVELPKLVDLDPIVSPRSSSVTEAFQQLEQLKNTISNLELRNAALEKLANSSTTKSLSDSELKELIAQNTKLAEEIYLLQQELGINQHQKQQLLAKISSFKRQSSLDMFSIRELINAIFKRIIK